MHLTSSCNPEVPTSPGVQLHALSCRKNMQMEGRWGKVGGSILQKLHLEAKMQWLTRIQIGQELFHLIFQEWCCEIWMASELRCPGLSGYSFHNLTPKAFGWAGLWLSATRGAASISPKNINKKKEKKSIKPLQVWLSCWLECHRIHRKL